jgi:ketosteroid isomerase-like protein
VPSVSILQTWLDDVGRAVLAGDYDTYLRHVVLPFANVNPVATLIVTTEAELRTGFDVFVDMLRHQRVTDYIRLVSEAHTIGEAMIAGSYVTNILANGQRVVPPFTSTVVLRRSGDGHWQAATIANPLAATAWPIHRVQPEPGA